MDPMAMLNIQCLFPPRWVDEESLEHAGSLGGRWPHFGLYLRRWWKYLDVPGRKLGSMVSNWDVTYTYKWGIWGYHLPTFDPNFQQDIQVREIPLFQDPGWWKIIIWPEKMFQGKGGHVLWTVDRLWFLGICSL